MSELTYEYIKVGDEASVEEPSRDTAELASIVAAIAAVMERTADDPFLPELHKRAEALAARLR